ncbi:MAG: hypothetical protein ACXWZB_00065 [Gaiellaceae bacterium]
MRSSFALLAAAAVALTLSAAPADASRYVRYGLQDDAWIAYGPGTLDERLDTLDGMGVKLVRYTLHWNELERVKGKPDWSRSDAILRGLHARKMMPVVTIWGTPRWANGGRSANWVPRSKSTFAGFAGRAANRYPFVKHWLIWNEPNQRRWLRPTSARVYTQTLLNPAYAAIRNATPGAKVGGGVTAPRGSFGGISPVAFIRGMDAAGARLDAYAHNPYPLHRLETPTSGGCGHCETITMSTIDRLVREVGRAFGGKRIWLTEYGYQTNPPDGFLGVSPALQSRYLAEAAHRAYATPYVDMLIQYLYKDEPDAARWQSGLVTAGGSPKLARRSAILPLAQVSRRGLRTVVWGQVRPEEGRQRYVLQQFRAGAWRSVGGARATTTRGFLTRTVRAAKGTKLRLWYPAGKVASPLLTVR